MLLAGCSSGPPNTPVPGLNGLVGQGSGGGQDDVAPGEAVGFTAFLVNDTGKPLVLRGATLLAMQELPAPKLARLGFVPGNSFFGSGPPWPAGAKKVEGIRVYPLDGAVIPSGSSPRYIAYGVEATKPGPYYSWGLRLTVEIGGRLFHVDASGASVACVVPRSGPKPPCFNMNDNTPDDLAQAGEMKPPAGGWG
jgi:hypothetical protein